MCQDKRLKIDELIEGVDFYWDVIDGTRYRVFTESYLKSVRTVCCMGGCRHCPWKYNKKNTQNKNTENHG